MRAWPRAAVAAGASLVVLAAGAARADAPGDPSLAHELALARHPPAAAASPSPPVAAPANDTEARLRAHLACMCPSCRRQALATCTCEMAAAMRDEVAHLLAGRDLSTEAARAGAYDAVRAAMAAKYGAGVLSPERQDPTGRSLGWLPVSLFAALVLWLAAFARRSRRRRRNAAAPADAE